MEKHIQFIYNISLKKSNWKNNPKQMKSLIFIIHIAAATVLGAHIQDHLHESSAKINPIQIIGSDDKIKMEVFHEEKKGKKFGQEEQYKQKIDFAQIKTKDEALIKTLKKSGAWDKIQLNTAYDYADLSSKVNFQNLDKSMKDNLSYELYTFSYDKTLEKQPTLIETNGSKTAFLTSKKKNAQYELLAGEQYLKRPSYLKVKQEWMYLEYKYNISKIKNQAPICIYSYNPGLVNKKRHEEYFERLEKINYTNYHIVYVIDNQANSQIKGVLNYLSSKKFSLKNKIKIVRNLQALGPVGSAYFWINKYCEKNEIVAIVDAADFLLGQQALKVVNYGYSSADPWFVHTRMFVSRSVLQCDTPGQSKQLTVPIVKYRTTPNIVDVSNLKTFKKQLFQKIKLKDLLEYQVDLKTELAYPKFYQNAPDSFILYPLLEMCGQSKVKFLTDFLYLNSGTTSTYACHFMQESFAQTKAKIKTPYQPLTSLNDKPKYVQNYKPLQELYVNMEKSYESYRKCARIPLLN